MGNYNIIVKHFMKAALIILLFPLCLTAQDTIPKILVINGTELWLKIGGDSTRISNQASGSASSATLSTIEAIGSYNGAATALFINDTIRGGTFFPYSGNDAADNGMIFADANNNKWKRQAGVNMDVRWYGAGAARTGIENWNAITAAKNYLLSHRQSFEWLYFPAGEYAVTYTLFFTESIKIKGGGGVYTLPSAILTFPWNTTGIAIHEYQYDFTSEIRNLQLKNTYSIEPIDSNKHLIDIRCKVILDNIYIPLASGVGINLEGCAGGDSTNNPIFGSVDFSLVTNCKVNFALHGFRTNGCDANYITFHNCDAMQNKRWGILDNGFLGNNFYSNSFAVNSNASIAGTATTVSFNGGYYTATFLHDDGSGINKQPDLFPTYWTVVEAQAATPWDNAKHYWSGGAFASTHPSGTSQWYSPYVEGDQPMPSLNTRSIIFAGVRGAGSSFGQIFRNQGTMTFSGKTNVYGGNFGIGVSDVANIIHPFTMESTVNGTLAQFKTSGTAGVISLQAAGNSNAYFWSQGGNLYYGVNGVQMVLNSTVFKDYGGNGVIDLGSAGNRFKDVHAVKYYGDGSALTGIVGGGGITQQALDDTAAAIRSAIPNVTGVTRVWLPDNVINNNASANTLADVTGLTFPVVAGTRYSFKVVVVYNSAATTTGSRWTVNGPAVTDISYRSTYNTTAAAATINTLGAYNLPSASNASSVTTNNRCVIEGEILPSANGDVQVRFASEISASAITAIGGISYLEYQIIN